VFLFIPSGMMSNEAFIPLAALSTWALCGGIPWRLLGGVMRWQEHCQWCCQGATGSVCSRYLLALLVAQRRPRLNRSLFEKVLKRGPLEVRQRFFLSLTFAKFFR